MRATRPLRIVHLTAAPNGAPWLISLAREQKRLGHDVTVILPEVEGTILPQLAASEVPVFKANCNVLSERNPLSALAILFRLARLIRSLRPDVLHTHLLPSVVTGRLAGWLADVPILLGMNAGPLTLELAMTRTVEIGTAWADTRTVASCETTRRRFLELGIPPERVELIYYAVDQRPFDPELTDGSRVRRELGIPEDVPVIGYVAYFYPPLDRSPGTPPELAGRPPKGHDVLLKAVPRVLESFPNARFLLVGKDWPGSGVEQELRDLARDLGISDAVVFAGERSDVPDVLHSVDVSVHCSLTENLGGTVESLLMERPMIVSDVGGMTDPVRHEETGLVVPPDDPDRLGEAIIRLLRNPDEARRYGKNGRQLMLRRFSLDRALSDYEALFQRLCAEHGYEKPPRHYRYRLGRSARRSVALPFHLLSLYLRVRRLYGASSRRQGLRLVLAPLERAGGLVRRVAKPSGPRSDASKPLRIAEVAGAWQNCEWFVDICRDLKQRGHDVLAVIDDLPGDLQHRLTEHGVRTRHIPMTFAIDSSRGRLLVYAVQIPLAALRLARLLRRERIELVQSHIFTSVVIARLAAGIARIPFHIATIPGPRHLEAPLTRAIDRFTWWLDDRTVAGSEKIRQLYRDAGAYEEKLETMYYGPEASRFDPRRADGKSVRRELGIDPAAPVIGLVAHFYPPEIGVQAPSPTRGVGPKGHEYFLEAARVVSREFPEARFVLAGSGTNLRGERYRQFLRDRCLSDPVLTGRVFFLGKRDDVPDLLGAMNVAVQCSLTENLGGTIESLLMEVPTVATRVGALPEAVVHGETGILVEPGDGEALGNGILELLKDPERAMTMAREGRSRMLERFCFDRTSSTLNDIIQRLTSQTQAAGARQR